MSLRAAKQRASSMAKGEGRGAKQDRPFGRPGGAGVILLLCILTVGGISSGTYAAEYGIRDGTAIALLDSEFTKKIYRKQGANYQLLFTLWFEAIQRQGLDFKVITDGDLERGDLGKYSALVLPGSVALSEPELRSIRRFARSGGGLLMGGATGTLNSAGKWRGWDLVKELAALDELEVLRKKDYKSLHVTLVGGSPLTMNIPAGFRIENLFYSENYAGRSKNQEAYWSEYTEPLYADDHNTYYTAVKTAGYGRGRIAWFGFNIESMSEQPESQRMLLTLFGNTLRWLKREPMARVALWPYGKKTAVSLTFDCENDFENLANLLNRQDAQSLRFTFFMLSSMAERFPELVRRATRLGEVAIHGDDHSIFKLQSYETQLQRLARAQEKLQTLTGAEVISFRPPEQRFDENTLRVLKKLGIRNFFSDYTGSSSPYFQAMGRAGSRFSQPPGAQDDLIIAFPRPNYDDYDLFVRHQLSNEAALEYILKDLNRVIKERGLYVLNMHTTSPWGGLTRHKIRVLSTLIQKLRQNEELWLTTVREAGEWWQRRDNIELKVTRHTDNSLSLGVINKNEKAVKDLVVEVYAPEIYSDLKVAAIDTNQPMQWHLDRAEEKLIVRIPALQPHEERRYAIVPAKGKKGSACGPSMERRAQGESISPLLPSPLAPRPAPFASHR